MKRYGKALLLIGMILFGLWALYDASETDLKKAKGRYEGLKQQVDGLLSERERYTGEIVTYNRNVKESSGFLSAWMDHYNATKDMYETLITEVAEKSNCVVVERKWSEQPVKIGKLDYDANVFTGKIVGDYRNIVKFIGELETDLQLSTIWDLEFKVGVNGVTCSIIVYFPKLEFEGGVL